MILLNKRRMDTARLTYLLFDKIIPEASNLDIVLNLRVNVDYCLAYLHLRQTCSWINFRIMIKLIKYESLLLDCTLIDAEE